jgi:hypothetical protein
VRSSELATGTGRRDRWRKVGLGREFTTRGEVVMREGPSNSGPQAQARGLGAGAIASLTGVGLLLIFMPRTPRASASTFCSGVSPGRCGS